MALGGGRGQTQQGVTLDQSGQVPRLAHWSTRVCVFVLVFVLVFGGVSVCVGLALALALWGCYKKRADEARGDLLFYRAPHSALGSAIGLGATGA